MKLKYKILLLLIVALAGLAAVGWNWEPARAAARKVVYNLRFNDGLVGYWSFNGADMSGVTATDRSSGGNNGTLTGGPIAIPGVVGQAINFDGVNDYVNVATNPLYEVSATRLSVSFWANIDASSFSGAVKLIFDDATGSPGTGGFYVSADDRGAANGVTPTKQLTANVMTAGGLRLEGADNAFDVGGGWHHYVVTYDGSSFAFYRDGAVLASELSTLYDNVGNFTPRDDNMALGSLDNGTLGMTGSLDEARIYDRVLTAAEIAYQYNKTKPASSGGSGTMAKAIPNMNNLASHWDFDDCDTCSSAADRSGNGNTATMYTTADAVAGDMHTTGKIGNGATFSGTANIAAPNIRLDDRSFSIGFWFNSGNLGSDRALLGQSSTGGCTVKNCLHLATRSSKLMFGFYFSDLAGNATLTTNKWYHAVFVYDKVAALKYIYLDGVLDNSGSSEVYLGTSGNTKIGTDCCDSGFIGTIDDVKIYTRAVGADEVKQIYNNSVRKTLLNMPQTKLINDGLVGFWSFNGQDMSGVTAIDRSGNGNNGTLTSGPVATPGVVGQALNFDGTNDDVLISDPANGALDFGTGDFTLSAWIKTSSPTAAMRILTKRDGETPNVGYEMYIESGDNSLSLFMGDSGGSVSGESGGANLRDGKWHNVAIVFNRASNAVYYVDGAQDGIPKAISSRSGDINNAADFYVGRFSASAIKYFLGEIDEVRIYNRALSVGEILQLYNAGKR